MLVVTPADVGDAAFARLLRDGATRALTSHIALPRDIDTDSAVRARALAWAVPKRAALSGLAALWVHGCLPGPAPLGIEVAVPRGANPDAPSDTYAYRWSMVTDPAAVTAAVSIGTVDVAAPAAACVAALRRGDLGAAIHAVMRTLSTGMCTAADVDAVLGAHSRRGRGYDRMLSAWREIRTLPTPPG